MPLAKLSPLVWGVALLSLAFAWTCNALAQAPAKESAAATEPSASLMDLSAYRVGPEDVLEVSVWREDGLKREVLVRPDGGISFPLIGDVRAAGRTVADIREEITNRLERFIPEAAVSVTVLKTGSQRVYVLGKVTKPGEFALGRYVDVLQALSMAGGLTPFADGNNIRVVRREAGRQVAFPFNYGAVVRGQKLEDNMQLRPGDVVVVP
jgi:polysaccharide export outer membrane protein